MPYCASRGGHAPGHLRDAFLDPFDYAIGHGPENLPEEVECGSKTVHYRWVLGQLWNCTDCLPGTVFELLVDEWELPRDSRRTYAVAARHLRALMQ